MKPKYDDIINLPHHVSKTHSQMPIEKRAAQFSPFAALSGHAEAISEAERLTHLRHDLSEHEAEQLDIKLQRLIERLPEKPEVSLTYFQPDPKKPGGSYITKRGTVRHIDWERRVIIFSDQSSVPLDLVRYCQVFFANSHRMK